MRILNVQPSDYAAEFAARRYVLLQGCVEPALLELARDQQLRFEAEETPESPPFRERDFDDPEREATMALLFTQLASLCSLERSKMTLSDFQLKAYGRGMTPGPSLHKDRLASEVTVGIPLRVAPESRLVLYPDRDLEPNPFSSSRLWQRSLDPAQTPQVMLEGAPTVEVDVRVGDAVVFQGSRIYHGRTHGAGATLLYIQLNALRLDPWMADPSTKHARRNSVLMFDQLDEQQWYAAVVELSPRLHEIRRHYTRVDWREVVFASVYQERDVRLTEFGLRLLMSIRDRMRVEALLERAEVPPERRSAAIAEVRRLVKFGAVDLIEPKAPLDGACTMETTP